MASECLLPTNFDGILTFIAVAYPPMGAANSIVRPWTNNTTLTDDGPDGLT